MDDSLRLRNEVGSTRIEWPNAAPDGRGAVLAAALLVAMSLGGCEAVPRGALTDPVHALPDSWTMLGPDALCELEVDPPEPRSIVVGCYAYDGELYIHTHRYIDMWRAWGESWLAAVRRDGRVRLGHEGRVYPLVAEEVHDEALRDEILRSRGFDPPPEGIRLVRLHARR